MDFAFDAEQDEFRSGVARFVAERWPITESRALLDASEETRPTVWKQMAGELGLQGLALPEDLGGQGFSFLELGIVFEELGRSLAGGPYFATVALAAELLRELEGDTAREWLGQIAAGDLLATVALPSATRLPDPADVSARLRETDGEARVSGSFDYVISGASAELVLAPALAGDEIVLVGIRSGTRGFAVTPIDVLDGTRRQATLVLDDAPAVRLAEPATAWPTLARAVDRAAIALAAEMLGGAARCLEMAVEYAKQRIQFARPIGSFQAIKHRAAEVLLEIESARGPAYWSWWVAAQPGSSDRELAEAASIAKSVCADAYLCAAEASIQIHGGIGFTWDADPHLYYRRAQSSARLLGDATAHRARLAEQLGF